MTRDQGSTEIGKIASINGYLSSTSYVGWARLHPTENTV